MAASGACLALAVKGGTCAIARRRTQYKGRGAREGAVAACFGRTGLKAAVPLPKRSGMQGRSSARVWSDEHSRPLRARSEKDADATAALMEEDPEEEASPSVDKAPGKSSALEITVETILFNSRFLAVFGVVGCLLSSVTMYFSGLGTVLDASRGFFVNTANGYPSDPGEISTFVIESMDNFMLATVLLVFALGLWELFVSEINEEIILGQASGFSLNSKFERPNWLRTKGLDDLKIKLGKVVVMIFLVKTLGFLQEIEVETPGELLDASLAVLASSVALFLAGLGINPWKNAPPPKEH